MTPSARLSAAIEVLADIDERRRPAPEALKDCSSTAVGGLSVSNVPGELSFLYLVSIQQSERAVLEMRTSSTGPLKKSASPNVTCPAPAATCAPTSASTTSTGTMRNCPL